MKIERTWKEAVLLTLREAGGSSHLKDIYRRISNFKPLTEERLKIQSTANGRPTYEQAVRSAISQLKKEGYIKNIDEGVYSITSEDKVDTMSISHINKIEESEQIYQREALIPEEILQPHKFYEGAVMQIHVNVFERDRDARNKCIDYYGVECVICGFNFYSVYGEVGKNFIHVHHLKPLSKIRDKYEVNPIQDLRPVCPNCHAIIHRRFPPFSIEEMQNFYNT